MLPQRVLQPNEVPAPLQLKELCTFIPNHLPRDMVRRRELLKRMQRDIPFETLSMMILLRWDIYGRIRAL